MTADWKVNRMSQCLGLTLPHVGAMLGVLSGIWYVLQLPFLCLIKQEILMICSIHKILQLTNKQCQLLLGFLGGSGF